jgi:hypothetical protein
MSEWIISEFDLDPNDPRGKTVNNSMLSYFNPILSIPRGWALQNVTTCGKLHLENLPWGPGTGVLCWCPVSLEGGWCSKSIWKINRLKDDLDFSSQGIVTSATRVPPHITPLFWTLQVSVFSFLQKSAHEINSESGQGGSGSEAARFFCKPNRTVFIFFQPAPKGNYSNKKSHVNGK